VINGTAGNDSLVGTSGNDTINGLAGNDTIDPNGGNDVIDGGTGSDSVTYATAAGAVVVDLDSFTSVERLIGSSFADSLGGTAGANNLTARGGDDTLTGAGGADTLWGGQGADRFEFREMGTANADRIADWASGSDKVALDDAAFTSIGAMGNFTAGDARFWSSSSGTAHDANDRVIYNTSAGSLYYDADGNGAGAAQLIATFTGNPAVAATDITVI
jgi:Ca2+-binding RTX toxin-like protein